MYNSAPDEPFKGFGTPEYKPANASTIGKVMKFIVNDNLKNPQGDKSTLAENSLAMLLSSRKLFIATSVMWSYLRRNLIFVLTNQTTAMPAKANVTDLTHLGQQWLCWVTAAKKLQNHQCGAIQFV